MHLGVVALWHVPWKPTYCPLLTRVQRMATTGALRITHTDFLIYCYICCRWTYAASKTNCTMGRNQIRS